MKEFGNDAQDGEGDPEQGQPELDDIILGRADEGIEGKRRKDDDDSEGHGRPFVMGWQDRQG